MSASVENGILDKTDIPNSSSEIQNLRKTKKPEENNFQYLKNSKYLKGLKLAKNKINKSNIEKTNTKKVKFNNDIGIINVECWKKYNTEPKSDEKDKGLDDENITGNKKIQKKNKDKKEHISCACFII